VPNGVKSEINKEREKAAIALSRSLSSTPLTPFGTFGLWQFRL
jgi:hypothetical protein